MSGLKHKASKQHEEGKNFMATLQDVGINISLYTGHSAAQSNPYNSDEDQVNDCDEPVLQFDNSVDVTPNDSNPLLFFYDFEST